MVGVGKGNWQGEEIDVPWSYIDYFSLCFRNPASAITIGDSTVGGDVGDSAIRQWRDGKSWSRESPLQASM